MLSQSGKHDNTVIQDDFYSRSPGRTWQQSAGSYPWLQKQSDSISAGESLLAVQIAIAKIVREAKRRQTLQFPFLLALALPVAAMAQGFKFSDDDKARGQEKAERQQRIEAQLSTPCRERIKNRRIMVVIGEEVNGVVQARQSTFRPQFDAINERLRRLGLRTYTQEEIRRQIAQAEIDAYFRNDPEAARLAAKRLSANYTLKGLISTRAMRNAVINVNQLVVSMKFVLTGADGRRVAQAEAQSQSFSGADVQGMAQTLVNEQAEEVVANLYSAYCQQPEMRGK